MKTARATTLALAIGVTLLGLFAVARPAAAQCVPDWPGGSTCAPACKQMISGGTIGRSTGPGIFGVPISVFIRNPVVSTTAWLVARPRTETPRPGTFATSRAPAPSLRGSAPTQNTK